MLPSVPVSVELVEDGGVARVGEVAQVSHSARNATQRKPQAQRLGWIGFRCRKVNTNEMQCMILMYSCGWEASCCHCLVCVVCWQQRQVAPYLPVSKLPVHCCSVHMESIKVSIQYREDIEVRDTTVHK